MNKKVLVNFACHGREPYNKGQLRLIRSFVEHGWDGDYLLRSTDSYVDEYLGVKIKLGSLPTTKAYGLSNNHAEVSYGFKCFLIQEAIEAGYEQIIWCDSSVMMERDIQPLLDYAKEHGVCSFDNLGHPLKFWLSDMGFQRLGITDAQLEDMKQIMACVLIFDMTNIKGKWIFEEWMRMCRDGVSFQMESGSTRPGYRGHRGDQPIISGLLGKWNVPVLPYGGLCYQPHDQTKEYGEPIYFVNRGIV